MNDVLNPDDGDAAPVEQVNNVDQLARLGVGQAAAYFIEQQHFWVRRERAGKFETLAIKQSKSLGLAIGQPHHAAQFKGFDAALIGAFPFASGAGSNCDEDIFENIHAAEGFRNLVRPGNS